MKRHPILEQIRKSIPLQTRIYVHLQMEDLEHWNNGEYSGKITPDCKEVMDILDIVEKWQKQNNQIYDKRTNL